MKNKTIIFALALPLMALLFRCTVDKISGNGTQTGNPAVTAMLYNPNGTPAAHAKVYFVPYNQQPAAPGLPKRPGLPKMLAAAPESTTTNDSGVYSLDSVPAGTYNVLASGSGNLAYLDSIAVKADSSQVPPDTLKAPGGIHGRVRLQPGDDARLVFILFMGTNFYCMPDDSTGPFNTPSLAEGKYRVRILTTLDQYSPIDTMLSVTAGKIDTLGGDIVLPYKGIPVPSGLKISYDTLKQIVTLTWNKPTTGRAVGGYNVYRKFQSPDSSFVKVKSDLADTVYKDSTAIQDQTYEYRVAAVDTNGSEGVNSSADSVLVTSAFSFIKTIGGPGTGDGQFNEPGEMAFDSQGNLYVLDPFNTPGKVHKFDSQGNIVKTWAPSGASELRDIEVVNDSILILDRGNKNVTVFDTTGNLLGEWPILSSSDPINFTVKSQTVYVVDRQNNMILRYSLAGNSLSAWTGIGSNTFKALMGIATNSNTGYFYLMDSDSLGYVADSSGNLVSQFKISRSAVVVSHSQWFLLRSGNLTYTGMDRPTIFTIDTNGNMVAKFGTFGSANGQFKWPNAVNESSNRIFISDAQNGRIQVFNE